MSNKAHDSALGAHLPAARQAPLRVPSPFDAMALVLDHWILWQRRTSERRDLAVMSPHMRRDAGLSDDDVASETAKPFWKA